MPKIKLTLNKEIILDTEDMDPDYLREIAEELFGEDVPKDEGKTDITSFTPEQWVQLTKRMLEDDIAETVDVNSEVAPEDFTVEVQKDE